MNCIALQNHSQWKVVLQCNKIHSPWDGQGMYVDPGMQLQGNSNTSATSNVLTRGICNGAYVYKLCNLLQF